jgi:lysophospholipase L1-like esterase
MRRLMIGLCATFWLCACARAPELAASPVEASRWIAAWSSAPSPFLPGGHAAYVEPYDDVTVRQVLRIDAGGSEVRVRFTNHLGVEALRIGAASLGRVSTTGVAAGRFAPLTFAGEPGVVIPPGAAMLSDAVSMPVRRFEDLVVSAYFPEPARPTGHRHRVDLSQPGDHTRAAVWPESEAVRGATVASGIQVYGAPGLSVLVAFGDSITEGAGATPGAHMSWPAQLSRRLASRESPEGDRAVVNAGISGNRILHDGGSQNGLARFERDALSIAGVTEVIVLEGINDLGVAYAPAGPRDVVGADDLIRAYRQMIESAHLRGVRIFGATILPYEGAVYFSPAGEAERVKVNTWIRDSGAFDGVVDLDQVMRDPDNPARLAADYEVGDRLHPNDAGYAAMADAVESFLMEQVESR